MHPVLPAEQTGAEAAVWAVQRPAVYATPGRRTAGVYLF